MTNLQKFLWNFFVTLEEIGRIDGLRDGVRVFFGLFEAGLSLLT